jgi:AraC-like DNA-binding protein
MSGLSQYCAMPSARLGPVPLATADIDRYVYASELTAIGAYRCEPDHAWFAEPGPIVNHCVVFPRTRLLVEPEGHAPFVGDENTISIYNVGQRYRRRAVTGMGDSCEYFAVTEPLLREVASAHDPATADRDPLFRVSHVPGDPGLYLRQRRLFHRATAGGADRGLDLDEQVLGLLDAVLAAVARHGGGARGRPTGVTSRHRDLVEHAKLVLARRVDEPIRLAGLARAVGSSPYHLCRVFRAVTGGTIHQHRQGLRLAAGLTRLETGEALTDIALDLGYSSHSHFTAAFRSVYGAPPRQVRTWVTARA